jgi:hypothetical protein
VEDLLVAARGAADRRSGSRRSHCSVWRIVSPRRLAQPICSRVSLGRAPNRRILNAGIPLLIQLCGLLCPAR